MERQWIDRLRQTPAAEWLGDDAAVLGETVLTTDMLTEGVDFLLEEVDATLVGRKALAVNLSDLAAMAAVPQAVLVSVALPRRKDGLELAERLYDGMQPLLEKYDVKLVGGDTNRWDGDLVLSITALGRVTPFGPLRRGGGRPGDVLLVTGPLGGSLLRHQFQFEPRVFEALYLNAHHRLHAGIDISDGLSLDLHRLALESGTGATLDAAAIPIAADAFRRAETTGRTPLQHALSDGEDFELILAVPLDEAQTLLRSQPLRESYGVTLHRLGTLDAEPGLRLREPDGRLVECPPEGFEH